MIYIKATIDDLPYIVQLLKEHNLPFDDIEQGPCIFIVALDDEQHRIGCIGLEIYGEHGLLRSFAVQESHRNKGIGEALLGELLTYAGNTGVQTLHLLTTTAQDYFSKKGFIQSARDGAPEDIANTSEFLVLCPQSAVYMHRSLSYNVNGK